MRPQHEFYLQGLILQDCSCCQQCDQ